MTVNAWKYGRTIYMIGRTNKFRYLTENERTVVIDFITAMLPSRVGLIDRLNLKYENAGQELSKQNSYALMKMVQLIGRNLKVQFPTEDQKQLCDAFIQSMKPRDVWGYYFEEESSSSSEESDSSSSSEESSSASDSESEQSNSASESISASVSE